MIVFIRISEDNDGTTQMKYRVNTRKYIYTSNILTLDAL